MIDIRGNYRGSIIDFSIPLFLLMEETNKLTLASRVSPADGAWDVTTVASNESKSTILTNLWWPN